MISLKAILFYGLDKFERKGFYVLKSNEDKLNIHSAFGKVGEGSSISDPMHLAS